MKKIITPNTIILRALGDVAANHHQNNGSVMTLGEIIKAAPAVADKLGVTEEEVLGQIEIIVAINQLRT